MSMKICAVLLVIWYLVSIIGFGIHTCMDGHHSFVTTFVSEVSCEDMHDDHAHDCDDHDSFSQVPCCSDDFMVLSVTGTAPSFENDFDECHIEQFPFAEALLSDIHDLSVKSEISRIMSLPDSGLIIPGNIQSVLGIWRI